MLEQLINALVPLTSVLLGVGATYWFTKLQDRESEWRKQKLVHYRDLLDAISSIVEGNNIADGQIRYARATNILGLVASQEVIAAMDRHREAGRVRGKWTDEDQKKHDDALVNLMLAIRRDLGVYPHDDPATFNYKLWSVGVPSPSKKSSDAIDAEFEVKS